MDLYQSLVTVNPVTLIAQICNLFIQLLIVKIFFLDKIKAVLDKRRETADKQIADAEAAKSEAAAIKQTYEENMRQAKTKADDMILSAQKTAAQRSEEIISQAQKQAAQIKTKAASDIEMEKKKAIIEKLNAIDDQMDTEEATQLVRDLMKEWNGIGHVPFKEKDRIYKQYHSQVDKLFEHFNISVSNKKLSNFKSTISSIQEGSPQALYREREKLVRAFDNMKNELQTYENNLGFLTTSSKKGNSLLTEINRKVEKLKADIELVKEKIKVVDENIKNQG